MNYLAIFGYMPESYGESTPTDNIYSPNDKPRLKWETRCLILLMNLSIRFPTTLFLNRVGTRIWQEKIAWGYRSSSTKSSNPSFAETGSSLRRDPPVILQRAIDDINSLSEVKQAVKTQDATSRHTLLMRVLEIFTRTSPESPTKDIVKQASSTPHTIVAYTLLARHAHIIGDVPMERSHRVQAIDHLTRLKVNEEESAAHRYVLASSNLALALCCLRSKDSEMQLAADAAASTAEPLSVCTQTRISAALLSALAAGEQRRTLLLSALTAVDPSAISGNDSLPAPDITGYARYFLVHDAVTRLECKGNIDSTIDGAAAADHALALVTRWDGRAHDFVEALVLAARAIRIHRKADKSGLALAEDLLTRALREVERVGNSADKAEPLLGLAQLCVARGSVIEAEGFFRAVEDALERKWSQTAFTVASANVYCRAMEEYACFLDKMSVDGRARHTEASQKRERAKVIQDLFPYVLGPKGTTSVSPWFVESMLPHFDLKLSL